MEVNGEGIVFWVLVKGVLSVLYGSNSRHLNRKKIMYRVLTMRFLISLLKANCSIYGMVLES